MSPMSLRAVVRISMFAVFLSLLFGCATAPKPLIGIIPGKSIETLQSAVHLTATSGEHSTGGRGYLAYRAPDTFHLAMVTPFGQSVLEAFASGDRFTCLIPSRETAYTGLLSDLPDQSTLKSMTLLKWVMEPPPTPVTESDSSGNRYYFDPRALLVRKVSAAGDEVTYEDYRNVDGVAFPGSLLITNRFGASVRIEFDDPQINAPVDDTVLVPALEGVTVLPLAMLRGI